MESNDWARRARAEFPSQLSHTQNDHAMRRAWKNSRAAQSFHSRSFWLSTGALKNAALNIWKATPSDATLMPGNSWTSPVFLPAASARNESRRLASTARNSMPQNPKLSCKTMASTGRRVILFSLALAAFTSVDRPVLSLARGRIARDLSLSDVQMGLVFGAFTIAYAACEIPSGWLGDRSGPEGVMTRIALWWALFMGLTSQAAGFLTLYASQFLFGAGSAGCYPSIARGFANFLEPKERARAHSDCGMTTESSMKPANPHILTINGGSLSIKFALFEAAESLRRILEGSIDRIGLPEATLRVKGLNQADDMSRTVSETSSDMHDLLKCETRDVRAAEAIALFCYQVKKWIGAFAAALGGLDTLVFAGGIGENAPTVRTRICDGLEFLGIELDETRNEANEGLISLATGRVAVRVIHTDEECMIAKMVCGVLGLRSKTKS